LPKEFVGRLIDCPTCGFAFSGAGNPPSPVSPSPTAPLPLSQVPPEIEVVVEVDDEVKDAADRGAGDRHRVRSSREEYCVECGAIIRARASVCPECGVSQLDEDALADSEHPLPKRDALATGLAWACPWTLVACLLLNVVHYVLYARLSETEIEQVRQNADWLPDRLLVLAVVITVLQASGFLVTVSTFVLGIMRRHRLAITLSAVTFVCAWPLVILAADLQKMLHQRIRVDRHVRVGRPVEQVPLFPRRARGRPRKGS
jgi:hypothetical protein